MCIKYPSSNMTARNLVLGLDIGTTSIKAVIIDSDNREVIQSSPLQDTNAKVASNIGVLGSEQDVDAIFKALQKCVLNLDHDLLKRVSLIGVTGQMHGCMLWQESAWRQTDSGQIELVEDRYSRLFTWQDSRCTREFLSTLPKPDSHLRLATGHGCASLFWLQKNEPDFVLRFDRAGTVMDFVVAALCNLKYPVMSVQNAASWGYYNTQKNGWNTERLTDSGFPTRLLPEVKLPGFIAGELQSPWLELVASGTRVGVAMGDLPCSVLPSLQQPSDAVINIGTSAQVVMVSPEGFAPPPSLPDRPVEFFPFFENKYLTVAASLNGGNIMASFIDTLQDWMSELGCQITKDELYTKAISAGLQIPKTDLVVKPTLHGERHQPDMRASVSNITTGSLSLGYVVRALCHGIVSNLYEMLPREKLVKDGVSHIIGCGSALTRNKILQQELDNVFGLPVLYTEGVTAAGGAALAMILYSGVKSI